ncbi:hypothetical protein [Yersinia enterocolitica]|uniref:hypothetical protein n=1 Tax=Yersinia enterocolitica TaxID=630 RepID=UPI00187D29CF|nr:hypothetical protein [Yersinia enterocolitica]
MTANARMAATKQRLTAEFINRALLVMPLFQQQIAFAAVIPVHATGDSRGDSRHIERYFSAVRAAIKINITVRLWASRVVISSIFNP